MTYIPSETIRLTNEKEQSLVPYKQLTMRNLPIRPNTSHHSQVGISTSLFLAGKQILNHSKEKLFNFLWLTQQQTDRLNRLLNPPIKKSVSRSYGPGTGSHDSSFFYLFQCMTHIGRQRRGQGLTTTSTSLILNRQLTRGAPGGSSC